MRLEEFTNNICSIYEDKIHSITLYGSAATGDFSKKYSDYNLILVFDEVTPELLERSAKLVKKWMKAGNPSPLFFDMDHIKTSADVFPMEFYDIKSNRKILFGNDPFAGVEIDGKNLRHQCEYEIKGKILQLYARYIQAAESEKEISKLIMESLSAFMSIFKGITRLLGKEPEPKKRALVEQLSGVIGFNPNIFLEFLDIRDGNTVLPRKETTAKFEDYVTELKTISNFVDKFDV